MKVRIRSAVDVHGDCEFHLRVYIDKARTSCTLEVVPTYFPMVVKPNRIKPYPNKGDAENMAYRLQEELRRL